MEPFLVEFKRKKVEKLSFLRHEGEEFLYVLQGTLEFTTEDEKFVLYEGDSLYFESFIPHAYRAVGNRNAKALTVVYSAR
jgi:quercetin dioxygenase-like cupin family protein